MTPKQFVEELSNLKFENVFNPYADLCSVHDFARAPLLRRRVLRKILNRAVNSQIDALWVGRELGYRGGRRSGLALTDDVNLRRHGDRWDVATVSPTKGQQTKEQTATFVWQALSDIDNCVFLWNVFPLHPHNWDNSLSNRKFNSHERQVGEEVLVELLDMLNPKMLLSLGNDAGLAVSKLCGNRQHIQVRHPSHGGKSQFLREVRVVYSRPNSAKD